MSLGKFAAAADAGRVFSVSTVVAGLAIPVSTTTAPAVLLWNPVNSGVIANVLRYTIAYVSGNPVAAAIGFQSATGTGLNFDPKGVLTAFAASTIESALIGGGASPRCRASAAGTNTLSAAIVRWLSTGLQIETATGSTANRTNLTYDFEGAHQIAPGSITFPCASAASVALFVQTIYWEEIPIAAN